MPINARFLILVNDKIRMFAEEPRLVEQMKEKQGVTEEQMAWVGGMNNIRACAEELVVKEIAYA